MFICLHIQTYFTDMRTISQNTFVEHNEGGCIPSFLTAGKRSFPLDKWVHANDYGRYIIIFQLIRVVK